jgi:hypothetical protein
MDNEARNALRHLIGFNQKEVPAWGGKQSAYVEVYRNGGGGKKRYGQTLIATKGKSDGLGIQILLRNYHGNYHDLMDLTIEQDKDFVIVKINDEIIYMTKKETSNL